MRTIVSVAIAAAIVALGSGVALAQSAEPAKVGESAKGKTLVDAKGMTLYVFDKDKDMSGKSACNGPARRTGRCCSLPTATRPRATGPSSRATTARRCGPTRAVRSTPGKNDKAPGDVDGDGKLNGAWHIAAP